MRKILKAMRSEKGFTLIELLVVIGILAAIAGVVTLAVGRFIGAGTCQACEVDRHNVQTAIVAYAAQNDGSYPAGMGDITGTYLMDDPKYDWSWDVGDGLVNEDCVAMVGAQCTTP